MSTNIKDDTSFDAELFIYYYLEASKFNQIPEYCADYLKHVLRHKELVYAAWLYLCDTLCELGFINESDMNDIYDLIIAHDDSKLQRKEFFPYTERFNGPRPKNPYVKSRFKEAVQLHKDSNLHHYESLKSYKGADWRNYAVELICDYIAMGWEFDNYVCEYFERVKDELKNELPEEYYNYIESIIKIIPEKFELAEKAITEETLDWIAFNYTYYQGDPLESNNLEMVGSTK